MKETIESVVVAFILAFVFRAFIVEAFVIPTGSMAPTLYGKHGTITCEDCGWEYAYGLSDQSHDDTGATQPEVTARSVSLCPNCRNTNTNLRIHDALGRHGNAESGDRILVLKWLFDWGGAEFGPRRWDVVVFKDPGQGAQNFIKRMVGKPEEVLEIIDGDVYAVPVGELSAETIAVLDELREVKYRNRPDTPGRASSIQQREAMADWPVARAELDAKLRILRKPKAAQEALWAVVYDHDYPPRRLDPGQPYWSAAEEEYWDTSSRRIHCDSLGTSSGLLRFAGKPITNLGAYNIALLGRNDWHPVSDLSMRFVLVPRAGQGRLLAALSRYEQTFWMELGVSGRVALYRTNGELPEPDADPLVVSALKPLPPDQPLEVEYQHVDYHVEVRINGEVVLATTPDEYAPHPAEIRNRVGRLSPTPRFWVEDMNLELWHLALFRDVYYTSSDRHTLLTMERTGWGTEGNPVWLRSGEYFMLGDNSPASKDSRLWEVPGEHLRSRGEDYQVGTVPRDQLVGRAFFVYWPSGLRTDLIPGLRNRGLIPNFGRMRWIH